MKVTIRLRDEAEKRNINQSRLVELSGISHTTVNRYWLGKKVKAVDLEVLATLAQALKCSPLDFFHIEK